MQSLQQITDAWGAWLAQKNNTSCMFTSSTTYSDQGELDNYQQNQCNAQLFDYFYQSFVPTSGSTVAYQTSYDNASSVMQTETFSYSATTTQSFNWSITEALNVGVSVDVETGLPFIAEGKVNVSASFDLSSTQGATSTNTQTWTATTPINVPAESSLNLTAVINTQAYSIPFVAWTLISGYVAIWFNDQVNLDGSGFHWLWFIPIASMLTDVQNNSVPGVDYAFFGPGGGWVTNYYVTPGGIFAVSEGQLTGSQGINTQVNITQGPVDAIAAVDELTERVLYLGAIAGN